MSPGRGMMMLYIFTLRECRVFVYLVIWWGRNIPWVFGGSFFKDFFPSTDDVDSFGAVLGESFGHHPADSGAAACDDGDDALDVEEVGGLEGG